MFEITSRDEVINDPGAIRLKGALFFHADRGAPWCVNVPKGVNMAQILNPESQGLAIFHLILKGQCWVQVRGGEPVRLSLGDLVVIPHGDTHLLGSGLQQASADIADVIRFRHRPAGAVGVAPMQYLARWRMVLAAGLLRNQQGALAHIAEKVGYGSAAAFSCAFKRQ